MLAKHQAIDRATLAFTAGLSVCVLSNVDVIEQLKANIALEQNYKASNLEWNSLEG